VDKKVAAGLTICNTPSSEVALEALEALEAEVALNPAPEFWLVWGVPIESGMVGFLYSLRFITLLCAIIAKRDNKIFISWHSKTSDLLNSVCKRLEIIIIPRA
jgi:hypothetical protein